MASLALDNPALYQNAQLLNWVYMGDQNQGNGASLYTTNDPWTNQPVNSNVSTVSSMFKYQRQPDPWATSTVNTINTVAPNPFQVSPYGSVNDLADQFSDLCLTLPKPNKRPPSTYLCHLCFTKGHFIKDCPQARPKGEGLTPYQGKKGVLESTNAPSAKENGCLEIPGQTWGRNV